LKFNKDNLLITLTRNCEGRFGRCTVLSDSLTLANQWANGAVTHESANDP